MNSSLQNFFIYKYDISSSFVLDDLQSNTKSAKDGWSQFLDIILVT